jgi:thiamine biosynthesis lipoprotein
VTAAREAGETFACLGSTCAVFVGGDGARGRPREAVAFARELLHDWHDRFSRFDPRSELARMNADPRRSVPVSRELAALAAAAVDAAERTGGLVDATLIDAIEAAGYTGELGPPVGLAAALDDAPPRRPAGPSPESRWREIDADLERRTVTRPPGVKLDSGGLAKGMFADFLAAELATHAAFAIDCAGDLRIGGTARVPRAILVASPFDDGTLHEFDLTAGGIATSGIGRRSWLDAVGAPAHHLLDPATGRPAYTGIVQVTAIAATALEAEIRAKAAILAGPAAARDWLPDGGVIVHDDGTLDVVLTQSSQVRPRSLTGAPSMLTSTRSTLAKEPAR